MSGAYDDRVARQRSGDLFPTDQPIPASQMIGREPDVRELTATLASGSNIVLAGPRRTGKTSVCDAVIGRLAREGHYTVSVDLFRIATAAELAEALVEATIANRSALRKALHQTRRAGRFVADALHTSAVLRSKAQLGEELEIAFAPGLASRDPDRYLDYALSLPGRIAVADSKEVIVFFDEFQEVAGPAQPYGDPDRLTKRMRAIFQRASGVSYLFAGSLEHMMRDLFVPTHRALHQFGGFHALRPIDTQAWRKGIVARFSADDCELDQDAVTRIIEHGELHPRTTMLIAQKSHLASVELETREIDLSIVEQGLVGALRSERASHEQTIERIRREHKLGLLIAERLARGEAPYTSLPRGSVRRTLESLRDASIIESHGRGDWRFTSPLLRRYLSGEGPFARA
jgi:uncharacterized protein